MLAVSKNTKSTLAKSIELANPNFSQKRIASMENSEQLFGFWLPSWRMVLVPIILLFIQEFVPKVPGMMQLQVFHFNQALQACGRWHGGTGNQLPHPPPPQNKPPRDMWVSLSESFESVRVVFSISQVPVNHS